MTMVYSHSIPHKINITKQQKWFLEWYYISQWIVWVSKHAHLVSIMWHTSQFWSDRVKLGILARRLRNNINNTKTQFQKVHDNPILIKQTFSTMYQTAQKLAMYKQITKEIIWQTVAKIAVKVCLLQRNITVTGRYFLTKQYRIPTALAGYPYLTWEFINAGRAV